MKALITTKAIRFQVMQLIALNIKLITNNENYVIGMLILTSVVVLRAMALKEVVIHLVEEIIIMDERISQDNYQLEVMTMIITIIIIEKGKSNGKENHNNPAPHISKKNYLIA